MQLDSKAAFHYERHRSNSHKTLMPSIVQYWAGCPQSANSKWQSYLAIVQRCQTEGWRSCLVLSQMPIDSELVEPFRVAGCEVVLLPRKRRNFDLNTVWPIYCLLRRLRCDVFHCYNDHTTPLIAAFLARVPVRIWSVLAMSPFYEDGVLPRGIQRSLLSTRISCWCAHRIMTISDRVQKEMIECVGFERRIETVTMPVNSGCFAEAAPGNIRRELKLNFTDVLVTSVGHAVPVKAWNIAIRSIALVRETCPEVHLALVGDITSSDARRFYQELDMLVRKLGLSGIVHFLGHRKDIPGILRASDMFVLPSRSEGMPAALIEAMAAGLACVASRVGGIPEVITHGVDGLLFERENVEELARNLVALIVDKSLRVKLAYQAAVRANGYCMNDYVEKVFRCYGSLLTRRSAIEPQFGQNHPPR